jgi:dTMP kinase
MGLFITFEGVEGCGKSTQSRMLKEYLDALAFPVLLTHEPGVTPLGEEITRLLKWAGNVQISPEAELLLFNASRSQLVTDIVRPALAEGTLVICDRYADSTTAYQGYGRQLDMDMVARANSIGTLGLVPDRTFLLDIPVETGVRRKKDDKADRFEAETIEFHRRVREGFLELAAGEPERWVIIDGSLPRQVIFEIIWRNVSDLLTLGEFES